MYDLHYSTAKAVARLLVQDLNLPSQDCLVMRLGTGNERNNVEAIQAYLTSPGNESIADQPSTLPPTRRRLACIRDTAHHLRNHLAQQTLDLWMLAVPGYPPPSDYVPQTPLNAKQQQQMGHALVTLFAADSSVADVDARCQDLLPGDEVTATLLARWVAEMNPRYTYNASELLLPLAKDLLLELCPDYTQD